ncbi:hypothetical protein EDB19DRAFT_1675841 [Suillus lakei]|nr:hypothetical protein EDB19DRAFT_1675841 [Suillus lakei]
MPLDNGHVGSAQSEDAADAVMADTQGSLYSSSLSACIVFVLRYDVVALISLHCISIAISILEYRLRIPLISTLPFLTSVYLVLMWICR